MTNLPSKMKNSKSDVITWRNQPVCTVKQASEFYKVDETNIQTNFTRNKSNFIEGKHFFTLKGDDLKEIKNRDTNCMFVGRNAKSLTLFTQKGMARLAKSCGSEKAWEVFEELEDTYFKVQSLKEITDDPEELLDLVFKSRLELQQKVKHLEATKAQISSSREAKALADRSHTKYLELTVEEVKRLESESFGYLKPNEIGDMVEGFTGNPCSAQKVNKYLISMGFQKEDKFYTNGKYCRKVIKTFYTHRPTETGKPYSKVVKHFNNSGSMKFLGTYKWKPVIASMIADFIGSREEL